MTNPMPPSQDEPLFPPEGSPLALFDELISTSEQILKLVPGENLPALNQLMLRRGQLLHNAGKLEFSNLEKPLLQALQEQLVRFNMLDALIGKHLTERHSDLEQQLRTCREGMDLLGHYRLPVDDESQHTRSQQA